MPRPAHLILTIALAVIAAGSARAACPLPEGPPRDGFVRPVAGAVVSPFGTRRDEGSREMRLHTGIDLAAKAGEPVQAAKAGEVRFAGERPGYGRIVTLVHAGGYETQYAQLSAIAVTAGDCVVTGAVIGRVGETARGPHLHFELLLNSRFLDPVAYLHW